MAKGKKGNGARDDARSVMQISIKRTRRAERPYFRRAFDAKRGLSDSYVVLTLNGIFVLGKSSSGSDECVYNVNVLMCTNRGMYGVQ